MLRFKGKWKDLGHRLRDGLRYNSIEDRYDTDLEKDFFREGK